MSKMQSYGNESLNSFTLINKGGPFGKTALLEKLRIRLFFLYYPFPQTT
jgi:hypothetical protein